jgi:hypothetical protein
MRARGGDEISGDATVGRGGGELRGARGGAERGRP